MNRRQFLAACAAVATGALLARLPLAQIPMPAHPVMQANPDVPRNRKTKPMQPLRSDDKPTPKITLTDDEWRARLPAESYRVLREEGTEPARSSPLDKEKRQGVFHCKGCNLSLFSSADKFDSGTGWPSFTRPIDSTHIGTKTDWKLVWPRTEVHCARCEGHLGHVFDDGPPPTGKRYCMNGVALTFQPV